MTEKFRNRYRVETSRLKGYDYTRSGAYYVTICTQKKIPYLAVIENKTVFLSEAGIIVKGLWSEIPNHFSNVILDEFVIMPDHIHGIIIINSNDGYGNPGFLNSTNETPKLAVSTGNPMVPKGNSHWKSKSLGVIINQFKRICTLETKSSKLDLVWQPRFYDHIIHFDYELECIRKYIKDNPENWMINE